MTPMELRRGLLMMNRASGSVFDSILEIVSSITPEQDVQELEFPCDLQEGKYIIVSNPPGNYSRRDAISYAQYLNMSQFDIRGLTNKTASGQSLLIRKTPSTDYGVDWWTPKVTITENGVIVSPTQGRYGYLAGVTYYLIRVKGM